MYLLAVLAVLLVAFFLLWKFSPEGWMTNIKTALLGLWASLPAFIDTLSNDVDLVGIFKDPQTVAIVAGVLVVMGFLARSRGKIRNTEPVGGK